MARNKKTLTVRKIRSEPYKKLFVIATEGKVTEPGYFGMLKKWHPSIRINCLKRNNKSAPLSILKDMKKYLKDQKLKKSDEAWIVVDMDQWREKDLNRLREWSREDKNFDLAVSNPHFEYWLLLHFEDGKGLSSSNDCVTRLKRHLPDYDKTIDTSMLDKEMILIAVTRAKEKARNNTSCKKWPIFPSTTVYRLVERIIPANET